MLLISCGLRRTLPAASRLVGRASFHALLVLVVGAGIALERADTSAAATPVCGTLPAGTTTWTNAGSPFQICTSGITVPGGATLVIDGATGPVEVNALGFGGISVNGGRLQTANTSTNAVTFTGPTATAGSWVGLSFTQDSSSNKGNGSLNNVTISSASTGISISSGALSTVGSTSFGLVLANVTISNTSGDGISASSTPISVSGGAITNYGSRGISFSSHNLTVDGMTISNTTLPSGSLEGILASGISARQVSITNNTIDGAGTFGMSLFSPSNVSPATFTLTGNTVKNSGAANLALSRQPHPAVRLISMIAAFGSTGVDGNHGNSNGLDAIAFDGTLTSSATWVTPTNSASDHLLGHLVVNGLTIASGAILTLPANAVVKTLSTLTFQGATLDATAGGATITTLRDNSVGPVTCPSALVTGCSPAAGDWGTLSFTQDFTTTLRGNGALSVRRSSSRRPPSPSSAAPPARWARRALGCC